MSLLFNTLSSFVVAFLPRSKHLLISWLQSASSVISQPKKIKFLTVSIISPSIYHEMMGSDAMILVLWMLSFKSAFSLSSLSLRVSYLLNGSDGKASIYNAGDPGSILGSGRSSGEENGNPL